MTTIEQVKAQRSIALTYQFMSIQIQRVQAAATLVGDGEQLIGADDLRALIDAKGVLAEEILVRLSDALDTSELPAVMIYDDEGHEVDSSERAS